MATAERLMDEGWSIQMFKQVDGKYCAAAKLRGEKWEDIHSLVDKNGQPLSLMDLCQSGDLSRIGGPRRPDRIGRGDSAEEAIANITLEI